MPPGIDDTDDDETVIDTVEIDRLQDSIDAVEANVSNRIEQIWTDMDEVNDALVELSAAVRDLPRMEAKLESVRDTVRDLTGETDDVQQAVTDLRDDLDSLDGRTATEADVRSVRNDLESVATDLETLRRQFTDVERADPDVLEEAQDNLSALRNSVIDQGKRVDHIEQKNDVLDDRIEQVFRNSAKSEALSSVETEVSRIRQTASNATETANRVDDRVASLERTTRDLEEDLSSLQANMDAFAGITPTESEMGEAIREVEDRLDALEGDVDLEITELGDQLDQLNADEGVGLAEHPSDLVFTLLTIGLASVGVLGTWTAIELGAPAIAVGFVLLVIVPAALLWAVVDGRLDTALWTDL